MTDTAIEQRDDAIERWFPLDTAARLRTIRGDLGRLDRLIEKFYLKAIAGDGDVNSAALVVKAWERKAELLGLDAVQRIDLQIINPPEAVPRHEKIREAIMRLTEQPPVRRAAIERIDQLGPEKALEMLGSPQPRRLNGGSPNDGNGPPLGDDSAVGVLSTSDGKEP